MRPVTVEIIAYTPTEFFHCMHCEVVFREGGIGQKIHAEQRGASLPPALAEQYSEIGAWATELADRYGEGVCGVTVAAVSLGGERVVAPEPPSLAEAVGELGRPGANLA